MSATVRAMVRPQCTDNTCVTPVDCVSCAAMESPSVTTTATNKDAVRTSAVDWLACSYVGSWPKCEQRTLRYGNMAQRRGICHRSFCRRGFVGGGLVAKVLVVWAFVVKALS